MLGKARPNSDRAASEPARQAASGALTGISGAASRIMGAATKARGKATEKATKTVLPAAAEAQRSQITQMAAALSYRTIFGLLPVLIIGLVAIKFFATDDHVRTAVERALWYTGLSGIAVNENPQPTGSWLEDIIGPPAPSAMPMDGPESQFGAATSEPEEQPLPGPVVPAKPPTELLAEPPGGSAEPPSEPPAVPPPAVDKWITKLIEQVNTISFKAIGFIGAVTLIYAAIAMLVEIERAFNQIYRVPRGRSWIRRIMQYWTLLTLGPLALLSTFYVGQEFSGRVQKLASDHGFSFGSGALTVSATGYAVTVLISTGFFVLAYICVPNTKVKFRPALIGALAAALMWEAGKWGFTQYLAYSTFNSKIYGALALIPLFLFWIYLTWLIVLFGLQIAYQLQHGRANTRAQPILDMGPALVDPTAALVVLSAIARGFEAGRRDDALAITKAARLPEPVVRLVLAKLSERGLLHRIDADREDGEATYVLARSPSGIRVAEVLELGYELAGTSEPDAAVERLHRVQIDAVGDQSLASIATQSVLIGAPRPAASPSTPAAPGVIKPDSQAASAAATLA